MSTKRCPFCNEEIPESATFCPACFQELGDSSAVFVERNSNAKGKILLIAGIVLCFVITLLWCLFKQPEDTQKNQEIILGASPDASVSVFVTPSHITMPSNTTPALTTATVVPNMQLSPTVQPIPTSHPSPTFQTVVPTRTNTPTMSPSTPEIDESIWSYTISNNKATINVYYGGEEDVSIPATLGGVPVYKIGNEAFKGNISTKHLYIPNSVQIIGESAFSSCLNLTSVYMEDSVTTLGASAFWRCEKLESVRLSDNIQILSDSSFWECKKLHTINMPTTLTTIHLSALGNTAIKKLSLPESLTTLPYQFGRFMSELEAIEVATGNSTFWSKDGVLFKRNRLATFSELFVYPHSKKDINYTMPVDIIVINESAFCHNPYLQQITLSQSLQTISPSAFLNCSALTTVKTFGNLVMVHWNAFKNCTNLTTIKLSSHVTTIGEDAFANCPNLTLTVEEGSYAHTYAIDNNIPYKLEQ